MNTDPTPPESSEPTLTEQVEPEKKTFIEKILPFLIGAVFGILIRVVVALVESLELGISANTEGVTRVMTTAFACFVPIAVGALTVYFAERKSQRTYVFYVFATMLSVTLFALGTGLILLEGSICIVLALPLFMFAAMIGGVLMGMACRYFKQRKTIVNGFVLLPFLVLMYEVNLPLPQTHFQIKEHIYIQQKPVLVWQQIMSPKDIQPSELAKGWAYRIGAPYPKEATTLSQEVGGIRRSQWQRGVQFDEKIEALEPNHLIRWSYLFNPDSFPKGSMDDHVRFGGAYFDLIDSTYQLHEDGAGTRLEITVNYRISTTFNWYTAPVANFFIRDTAQAILNFYKNRAEAVVGA